jgi:hypothetical protein
MSHTLKNSSGSSTDQTPRNLSTSPSKVLSPIPAVSLPTHDPEGTIFDVSNKVDVYGKGKSYNLFAGKDASRALGMSSLKPEDAISDYSTLPENERSVLEEWYSFFGCVYLLAALLASISNPPPLQETVQHCW